MVAKAFFNRWRISARHSAVAPPPLLDRLSQMLNTAHKITAFNPNGTSLYRDDDRPPACCSDLWLNDVTRQARVACFNPFSVAHPAMSMQAVPRVVK